MDELESVETLELDEDSFITIEITRQWPRYVASWSVRRREGESDYPVKSGEIERMPPRDPSELPAVLARLRQDAVTQATEAVQAGAGDRTETKEERSLLGRLFGRR